ncbi:UPF0390 protein [Penicillium hispanicum]|uniref:UPF0390 protein n=1 Tax=Penicillium hispanicum TaxID=1080232 RepID=UPI00254053F6|nr:UPF0390 protein [Penicillium hispanicum]KAJ5586937.1 UPF0390 protein [Penicillium hispanicum]
MAQGLLKKSKPATASAKRASSNAARTKPGPRQVAPKKASLIKAQKLNKSLTLSVRARLPPSRPSCHMDRSGPSSTLLTLAAQQKLTSGLVAKTERSLAQKAGHLEMLGGGKKDKGEKGKKK